MTFQDLTASCTFGVANSIAFIAKRLLKYYRLSDCTACIRSRHRSTDCRSSQLCKHAHGGHRLIHYRSADVMAETCSISTSSVLNSWPELSTQICFPSSGHNSSPLISVVCGGALGREGSGDIAEECYAEDHVIMLLLRCACMYLNIPIADLSSTGLSKSRTVCGGPGGGAQAQRSETRPGQGCLGGPEHVWTSSSPILGSLNKASMLLQL